MYAFYLDGNYYVHQQGMGLYKMTDDSLHQFSQNKNIPKEFELPILTALSHFPELKHIHINFVTHEAYSPLSTRPALPTAISFEMV